MPASRFTKDETQFLSQYHGEWVSAGNEKCPPGQPRPRHKLLAQVILDFYEKFPDRDSGGGRAFEDEFRGSFMQVGAEIHIILH